MGEQNRMYSNTRRQFEEFNMNNNASNFNPNQSPDPFRRYDPQMQQSQPQFRLNTLSSQGDFEPTQQQFH
jgi:hypothetical protein